MRLRLLLFIFLFSGFFAGVEAQWLAGYGYRKSITIPAVQISGGPHVNFPVLVSVTDNDLRTTVNGGYVENSNGWDIAFSEDDTNPLDHQVESYDPSTGELIAWVRIPSLPAGGHSFNVYFGNSSIGADPSTTSTWVGYSGVWHLNGSLQDATSNGNNGTNFGSSGGLGMFANGRSFDGINDRVQVPDIDAVQGTVSFWFRPAATFNSSSVTCQTILNKYVDANNHFTFVLIGAEHTYTPYGAQYFKIEHSGSLDRQNSISTTWNAGQWYFVAGTWGSVHTLLVNGAVHSTANVTRRLENNAQIEFGGGFIEQIGASRYFNGRMDEIRISSVAKSNSWIATEYNNQIAPASFMTFGGLEQGLPQAFNVSGSGSYCNGSGGLVVQLSGSESGVNYQLTNNGTNQGATVAGTGGVLTWPGLTEGVYKVVATKVSSGLSITMAGKAVIIENPLPIVTFGYSYYKTITINSGQVSGAVNLIDFPLLVSFTDPDLATVGNGGKLQSANGYDVAFLDAAGNPLKFEISQYNPATGSYKAWVKVPVVSPSANTDILMLYGKSGITSNPSSRETWSSDYVQVMHLDGDFLDATDAGNYGENSGTSGTTGKLLYGRIFDGVNDKIVVDDDPNLDGTNDEATMSLWINYVDAADGDYQIVMSSTNRFVAPRGGYEWASQGDGDHFFYPNGFNTNNYNLGLNPFTDGTWQHLAVTLNYSTQEVKIFVNGSPMTFNTIQVPTYWTALADIDSWLWGGNPVISTRYFRGLMDEIRVQTVERTQDWLLTEFRNQNNPSSFYSVSTENPYKPLPDVCLDDAAFVLNQARPAGGTYSGTGVSGGTFNPRLAGVGNHTITYNYTDANGCTASGSATQTVLDLPTPTISGNSDVCPNASGETYNTPDIANHSYNWVITGVGATISAGQGTHEITVDWGPTSGTLTLTETNDITGCDSTTAAFNVNVADITNPTISCVGDQTKTADAGQCYYTVVGGEFDPTATNDNCGIASVVNDFNGGATLAGAQIPHGTTIIWTITDNSTNSANCSFTVTVNDTENPTISCVGDQTKTADAGQCYYTVVGGEFDPTATNDNCGIA
ncbi:MAG: DUF2341 domain-containing protein, partial [Bacteroidales bacterium]|nr:DUF2341 domain-containing protein [Bacteroidales bacterium]